MWKITYSAWLRKWLDSVLSLSHIIFLRNVTAIKYYFPLMNLLISAINKSQLGSPSHFPLAFGRSFCRRFALCMPSFSFTLVKTLTLFCTDGSMGVYQLSEGTSECAGLRVYAPVPVAAACVSWYALIASLFSMDMPESLQKHAGTSKIRVQTDPFPSLSPLVSKYVCTCGCVCVCVCTFCFIRNVNRMNWLSLFVQRFSKPARKNDKTQVVKSTAEPLKTK